MKRIRTNIVRSYWTVGYLVQFNDPRIFYSKKWKTDTEVISFINNVAEENGIGCWVEGTYIFRVFEGTYYARYKATKYGDWEMLIPSVKFDKNKPLTIPWVK